MGTLEEPLLNIYRECSHEMSDIKPLFVCLFCSIPRVLRYRTLEWSSPSTLTLTPVAERLAVELSLPVLHDRIRTLNHDYECDANFLRRRNLCKMCYSLYNELLIKK